MPTWGLWRMTTWHRVPGNPCLPWACLCSAMGTSCTCSLTPAWACHSVVCLRGWVTQDVPVPHAVLQGLIEVRSPYLEELLTALFSATMGATGPSPASKAIVVVSSLLQEEEPLVSGKQDTDDR